MRATVSQPGQRHRPACNGPAVSGGTSSTSRKPRLSSVAPLPACSGLPERLVDPEAARLLKQLGLAEFADRACASYSGGNRRKLSVAVSCRAG